MIQTVSDPGPLNPNPCYLCQQTVCPVNLSGIGGERAVPSAQQTFIFHKRSFNVLLKLLLCECTLLHTDSTVTFSQNATVSLGGCLWDKNLKEVEGARPPLPRLPSKEAASLQQTCFKSPDPVKSLMTSQTSRLTLQKPEWS